MRRQRFTHVSLVEALVVGVIAIAVIGVTLTTRLGTGGPMALEAAASPLASPETEASPAIGLLAKELVSGNLQLGHDSFELHDPAQFNVAGDPTDPMPRPIPASPPYRSTHYCVRP